MSLSTRWRANSPSTSGILTAPSSTNFPPSQKKRRKSPLGPRRKWERQRRRRRGRGRRRRGREKNQFGILKALTEGREQSSKAWPDASVAASYFPSESILSFSCTHTHTHTHARARTAHSPLFIITLFKEDWADSNFVLCCGSITHTGAYTHRHAYTHTHTRTHTAQLAQMPNRLRDKKSTKRIKIDHYFMKKACQAKLFCACTFS